MASVSFDVAVKSIIWSGLIF